MDKQPHAVIAGMRQFMGQHSPKPLGFLKAYSGFRESIGHDNNGPEKAGRHRGRLRDFNDSQAAPEAETLQQITPDFALPMAFSPTCPIGIIAGELPQKLPDWGRFEKDENGIQNKPQAVAPDHEMLDGDRKR